MNLGIIGLGKMGNAIAYRALKGGHKVFGFDINENSKLEAQKIGVEIAPTLADLVNLTEIIWLMLPAGKVIDDTINSILPGLRPGKIIIDGGNSNFHDSIARAEKLKKLDINFLDCGVSGGLQGREFGFSLMIGGQKDTFEKAISIFRSLSAKDGFAYLGPSGSGHYVKMVHNGIEYALLQSYAEGFNILKNCEYDLDLAKISEVWLHGSIIRSWILELAHNIFLKDQEFKNISGEIGSGQTGTWTVQEAKKIGIQVPLIEKSLEIRKLSQQTGGNYATKLVALLRHEFGGHEVKKI